MPSQSLRRIPARWALALAAVLGASAAVTLLALYFGGGSPPPGRETPTNGAPIPRDSPKTPAPTAGWLVGRHNTGLAGVGLVCDALPRYTGPARPVAGTVIREKRIESSLTLSAGNVTIVRSCVQPRSVGRGLPVLSTVDSDRCGTGDCPPGGRVLIEDSEIDGSLLSDLDAAFTVGFYGIADLRRNYVHRVGSGIAIIQSGRTLDALVQGNYVTKLRAWGDPTTDGNHSDAFTLRGFDTSKRPNRRAEVRGNRFDCSSRSCTGALFVLTIADDVDNVRIEKNLLQGGGYHLALGQDQGGHVYGPHMEAVDNRFSSDGLITYVADGRGWATWTGNSIDAPDRPDHRGKTVPEPRPIAASR